MRPEPRKTTQGKHCEERGRESKKKGLIISVNWKKLKKNPNERQGDSIRQIVPQSITKETKGNQGARGESLATTSFWRIFQWSPRSMGGGAPDNPLKREGWELRGGRYRNSKCGDGSETGLDRRHFLWGSAGKSLAGSLIPSRALRRDGKERQPLGELVISIIICCDATNVHGTAPHMMGK